MEKGFHLNKLNRPEPK